MKRAWISKISSLLIFSAVLILSSCIDGYHDDWTFSSGVENTTLSSPMDTSITITKNPDGSKLIVTWPVVLGAKGYEVSVFNVDDPLNPIAINSFDSAFVDGCSIKCDYLDDTRYKFQVKALGNDKYKNKDADSATVVNYTTLLPAHQIIPDNTDLYQYFQANVIPDSTREVAYELVANGHYTISGPLNFNKHWIVFRGDKIYHPTVTYTSAGRIQTTSGLTIKYINFDCSAIPSTAGDGAFLTFSPTPDAAILGTGSFYTLKSPKSVMIYSCNFTPMTTRLVYDSGKKYCIENLTIKNCIIPLAGIPTDGIVFMKGGFVNNIYFTNNTIYGTIATAGYLIKYENSGRPDRAGFINGTINMNNNTFYNVVNTGQMANYPAMSNAIVSLNLSKNIFVNCGSNGVCRRLSVSATTMVRTFSDNCYWFGGAFPESTEITPGYGDKSGTGYGEDPQFSDPSTGNFTIGSTATTIISRKSGDPRWLPKAQ